MSRLPVFPVLSVLIIRALAPLAGAQKGRPIERSVRALLCEKFSGESAKEQVIAITCHEISTKASMLGSGEISHWPPPLWFQATTEPSPRRSTVSSGPAATSTNNGPFGGLPKTCPSHTTIAVGWERGALLFPWAQVWVTESAHYLVAPL